MSTNKNSVPFVTIITCVFNREIEIREAISSVLIQTWVDWELIIIDDKSTDNTVKCIEEYISDHRIKLIQLEENYGPHTARSVGVNQSRGNYIFILDSDNKFAEAESLKIALEKIKLSEHQGLHLFQCITTSGKRISENVDNCEIVSFQEVINNRLKSEYKSICEGNLLRQNNFDTRFFAAEGLHWLKIIKKQGFVCFHDYILQIYNDEGNNRISSRKNYINLLPIYKEDLKIFGLDRLWWSRISLIKLIIKIIIYQIFVWYEIFRKRIL